MEIERRKKLKEEEQERLRVASSLQETVQENGHLTEESAQQTIALQTKPVPEAPETTPTVPEAVQIHKNGRVPEEIYEAEVRMISGGITIPHVDKVASLTRIDASDRAP